MAVSVAQLQKFEQKAMRRSFQRGGWRYALRYYYVATHETITLPRPGAYFPGETSGYRVSAGGVSSSIQSIKEIGEVIVVRIMATEPILDASTDTETFTLNLVT